MDNQTNQTEQPIFVIGCPRSGTTILSKMLEPTIYGSPIETHFITKYYKKLPRYKELAVKKNFSKLVKAILKERPIQQWKIQVDIDQLWKRMNNFTYSELVHALCMERFSHIGKKSWGDKTPHYILELEIIYKLFPKAKYIYIVRDGRDVALSLLKKPWGPNNLYSCAIYWKKCNQETSTLKKIRSAGNLFELRYEDLLKDPEKVIRNIYSFLGESYREELMSVLIRTIDTKNFDKWKRKMKPSEIKNFEGVAANTLRRFGYSTSYPECKSGQIRQTYWNIHEFVLKCLYLFKLNFIDFISINFFGKEPFAE